MSLSFKIFMAADHGGFALKQRIIDFLQQGAHSVIDLGTHSEERCDAGDYAVQVAQSVAADINARGILICKTGTAMAMTANRFRRVRAALSFNSTMARLAREHNDANVLVLGSSIIGEEVAFDCVSTFINTAFLGGRYESRRHKLESLGGVG